MAESYAHVVCASVARLLYDLLGSAGRKRDGVCPGKYPTLPLAAGLNIVQNVQKGIGRMTEIHYFLKCLHDSHFSSTCPAPCRFGSRLFSVAPKHVRFHCFRSGNTLGKVIL